MRDKIPQILEREGKKFRIVKYVKDKEELLKLLLDKLVEEVYEFIKNPSIEEAADILEVLESILKIRGYSLKDVLDVKEVKRIERGGFDEGIVVEIFE